MDNNRVNIRGAIRSALSGLESTEFYKTLFEVIDNRLHSNSKSVFIDFDTHNKKCIIGYENPATKYQINNTTTWYNINNSQKDTKNIASKGIGLRYFEFKLLGNWQHVSKVKKDVYFISDINTSEIDESRNNNEISDYEFNQILSSSAFPVRQEDGVKSSIEDIFNNENKYYPFNPNTIFIGKNICDIYLNDYKNDEMYNFEDLIKSLKIKYFEEIKKNNLKLYIKLPGQNDFIKIKPTTDVIGSTNRKQELNLKIYIDERYYLNHIFNIDDSYYQIKKNGNSKIREEIKNYDKSINEHDYNLSFYINNNTLCDEDIIGRSEEKLYTGLYIKIGQTFISDRACVTNIDKRNLPGSKSSRSIISANTEKAKITLKLNGLKSEFNLTLMKDLHIFYTSIVNVYKKYCKIYEPEKKIIPNDYVLISSSNKKTIKNETTKGYIYIVCLAENFYKLGKTTTNNKRLNYYTTEESRNKLKKDFPGYTFYKKPYIVYFSLEKLDKYNVIEQELKCFIAENENCVTYDNKKGDEIREYFETKNIQSIIYEIVNKYH